MSNINKPKGLEPLMRNRNGGAVQTNPYTKAAAYGYAIYMWDPVTLLAGVLNGPASGITPGTTRFRGVSLAWSVASVLATHEVIDSADAMYDVQGDGSGATSHVIAAATMGYNANLNVATLAGGTVTRNLSGVQLTESTIDVTATLDVNIERLVTDPNNAYGLNGRVEVRFNKFLGNPEVTVT